MATYNTDPSLYKRPVLKVGLRIGQTTVIGVHEKTYTAQCDCGETLNKDQSVTNWPMMCGTCAKAKRGKDNMASGKPGKNDTVKRDNTQIEQLMIKEFKGKLSAREKIELTTYREKLNDKNK